VTERHKVGVALQESENKYRNLVDNALVGIFTTTLKGDILYANRSICTILDFPSVKEFIKTKAPTRYKNPEDRKHFLELLQKNGKVSDFEVTLLTRKGHEKQVVMSAALEGDTLSGMMMDITQRKVAEKDLHQKVEQMEFMSRLNLKRYEKMMEQQRDIIKLKRALGQEPPSLEEIHQLFSDLKS
jgi:PAS domain S-box-containing protein